MPQMRMSKPKLFLTEPTFVRKSKKLIKRNRQLDERIRAILLKLSIDPFDPSLHTHPLTGRLKGIYACSLTSDMRILFSIDDHIIHLLDIGTHEEVY